MRSGKRCSERLARKPEEDWCALERSPEGRKEYRRDQRHRQQEERLLSRVQERPRGQVGRRMSCRARRAERRPCRSERLTMREMRSG